MGLADKRCGQRIVSLLEGGYDLEALSKSASFHLDALMGRAISA
jgi:acetoin utilization deacetylase AcuC-like enzyme